MKLIICHTAGAEQSYRLYTDFALFNEKWKNTASPRQMLYIHSYRPCHLRKNISDLSYSQFWNLLYPQYISYMNYKCPIHTTIHLYLIVFFFFFFLLFLSGLDSLRKLNCLKIKVWLFKDHFLDVNILREIFLNY